MGHSRQAETDQVELYLFLVYVPIHLWWQNPLTEVVARLECLRIEAVVFVSVFVMVSMETPHREPIAKEAGSRLVLLMVRQKQKSD